MASPREVAIRRLSLLFGVSIAWKVAALVAAVVVLIAWRGGVG